jgi:hypothetical protein
MMLVSVLLGVALQVAVTAGSPGLPAATPAPTPSLADSSVHHARLGRTVVRMSPPIDTVVTIDGRLDEAVWSRAQRLTGFSLYTPVDQRPAPDSTDVLRRPRVRTPRRRARHPGRP